MKGNTGTVVNNFFLKKGYNVNNVAIKFELLLQLFSRASFSIIHIWTLDLHFIFLFSNVT